MWDANSTKAYSLILIKGLIGVHFIRIMRQKTRVLREALIRSFGRSVKMSLWWLIQGVCCHCIFLLICICKYTLYSWALKWSQGLVQVALLILWFFKSSKFLQTFTPPAESGIRTQALHAGLLTNCYVLMANVGSSLNLTNLMEDDLSAEGEEKIPGEDTHILFKLGQII